MAAVVLNPLAVQLIDADTAKWFIRSNVNHPPALDSHFVAGLYCGSKLIGVGHVSYPICRPHCSRKTTVELRQIVSLESSYRAYNALCTWLRDASLARGYRTIYAYEYPHVGHVLVNLGFIRTEPGMPEHVKLREYIFTHNRRRAWK